MPTAFPFSEPKIKALKPPSGPDREYHKDTHHRGLQVCVTAAGAKTYYYVRRIDGRPTRVKLGTVDQLSVEAARKAAAQIGGDVAAGKNPQAERRTRREEPTLTQLWEHWLLHATAHKRPRSVEEDRRNYRLHLAPLAGRRLSTIKKVEVQALHARIGREKGVYAANRVLALLRAMLNKAEDIGHRGTNPAAGVRMFKEEARDRFLHPQELQAFFQALAAETPLFRDFFAISLLTGARKSNVLAMAWTDVDLQAGYWRIPETKGGSVVVVPLVAPAVAILQARREQTNGSPWVFPGHRHGTHLQTPKGAWKRIVNRAGLVDLRPHDLRRSLGSWMAGQNVSLTIVGKVLGHKTPQATAIYARVAMDPQRAAMNQATAAMLKAGRVKLLEGNSTPQREEGGDNGTQTH
jgi:integrase